MYVMFSCVYVTLGQMWYLFASIPDLCLLTYFYTYQVSLSLNFFNDFGLMKIKVFII